MTSIDESYFPFFYLYAFFLRNEKPLKDDLIIAAYM